MPAEIQIALWGAAVALVVLLNFSKRGDPDGLGLSVMVLLIWIMGRVTGTFWTPPQSLASYPLIDFIAGCTVLAAYRTRREPWKLDLCFLYLIQLLGHAAFWGGRLFSHQSVDQTTYLWWNNSVFAMELFVLGAKGVRDGLLAGSARAWLRGRLHPDPG